MRQKRGRRKKGKKVREEGYRRIEIEGRQVYVYYPREKRLDKGKEEKRYYDIYDYLWDKEKNRGLEYIEKKFGVCESEERWERRLRYYVDGKWEQSDIYDRRRYRHKRKKAFDVQSKVIV